MRAASIDEIEDVITVARDGLSLHVDVAGRASRIVGGQQHAAFEYKSLAVPRYREPSEESFKRIKLVQFVGGSALAAGQILQIQICAALDGGPCRSAIGGHSRISSAACRAGSAFGNARAIASRAAGWFPRRRSHRRNASTAISGPSR